MKQQSHDRSGSGDGQGVPWEFKTVGDTPQLQFIPYVAVPIQFFGAHGRKYCSEGEKLLRVAVLEDAVNCFHKHALSPPEVRRKRRLFLEAEQWFFGEDEVDWPFSFENVCAVLGLNPDYIRRGLRRWREQALSGTVIREARRRIREAPAFRGRIFPESPH